MPVIICVVSLLFKDPVVLGIGAGVVAGRLLVCARRLLVPSLASTRFKRRRNTGICIGIVLFTKFVEPRLVVRA